MQLFSQLLFLNPTAILIGFYLGCLKILLLPSNPSFRGLFSEYLIGLLKNDSFSFVLFLKYTPFSYALVANSGESYKTKA